MLSDNDLRKRYDGQQTYIGRSRRKGMMGPSLSKATKQAYSQAAADGGAGTAGEEKMYRVLDLWAIGRTR
jgi:hypothetical protein